jgi:hypothetical protein
MYTLSQAKELLALARKSIEASFTNEKVTLPGKFKEKRGVFVTLTENEELRGCIGFPYPTLPLEEAIVEAAKSSAFCDHRFPCINQKELAKIRIEISILTKPKPAKPEEVKIGKDGIICEYKGSSGLLLPQVALEWKMSREEFLDALCEKAFLPKGTWKEKDFKLWKFQAQIFHEGKNMNVKEEKLK